MFFHFIHQTSFLLSQIQKLLTRPITRTKLLYSFPQFKQCKFHPLVDSHKNYVIVVQLQNDMKIAAYSYQPLIKGAENKGPGFLSSLTNKQSFSLKKIQKAKLTIYNDFFLKFGNSEFLIKLCEPKIGPPKEQELKFKSNFGESNTNDFDCREFKDQRILLGQKARESKLRQYEVFQVFFDDA